MILNRIEKHWLYTDDPQTYKNANSFIDMISKNIKTQLVDICGPQQYQKSIAFIYTPTELVKTVALHTQPPKSLKNKLFYYNAKATYPNKMTNHGF